MDEELTSAGAEDKYFTVSVDSPSQCKRTIRLEVTEEAYQKEKSKIVEKLRRNAKVPGFRKGKVPADYIRKNYDDEVHADAVQNLLEKGYQDAVTSESLFPLADPKFEKLDVRDGGGFSVEAHIEVKPDIEISGYKRVSVRADLKKVDDAQVAETLQSLRGQLASYHAVDRPAEIGDHMVIDFAPYLESGELDEKARQKEYTVALGGENLLPEFRTGLVGMKTGGEKEIRVEYPKDFPDKKLANMTKTFHVTAKEVKEELLPALDDAFAKNVAPDAESLEALKDRIREDLQKEEDSRYKHEIQEKIIDSLIEKNPFEVPDVMVENYLASLVDEDQRRRPQVESEEKRQKEIVELFHESAVRTVKKFVIMESVVRQEDLGVTDEEFEERIKSLAEGTSRPVEDVEKMFHDPQHRRRLASEIIDQKVLNFLWENADIGAA
ncbi:MAG: trigger factor [Candidatus Krumholzibacteria bacterium]|nr:trigger factor [Candidatus Krumholzibacteria bacterium]